MFPGSKFARPYAAEVFRNIMYRLVGRPMLQDFQYMPRGLVAATLRRGSQSIAREL